MLPRADDETNAGSDTKLAQGHVSLARTFWHDACMAPAVEEEPETTNPKKNAEYPHTKLGLRHLTCLAINHTAAFQPELCDEQLET